DGQQHVPVVFMTHLAQEGAMRRALARINRLEVIRGESTRLLRVEDI
ncbi:MAG: homoserine dehydrogenase, partial [Xanthomonadales bacterium]|nr:homoserine dehydrogenase [Xanthomonadales bacterium]NIO15101.1 homoserine dehydrogenase [Xanthomonadales bacterium]NIO50474.1 homoserine dehydrogenase [Hydrogenophaga sp.]